MTALVSDSQWLDTTGAATYLSLLMDTFRRKVRAGIIPPPSHSIGERSPRWRRADLDAMMMPSSASSDNSSWVAEYVASLKEGKGGKHPGHVRSSDSAARRAVRARWGVEAAERQQSRCR